MLSYLSLCSGIEAASVAWQSLGWQPVAFAEIEPFPCAVLAHHYPHVPNLGDMTTINGSVYRGTVDLIVGGTPCQSFSVAGKRGGISDPRGALALAFVELVRDVSPRWFVWENVPGVFSSGGGADFKAFASAFVECGYHVAWRVLDAQYFGVPQRRRRVYLVGHFGDWRPSAAVLFEPHSLCGNTATCKKKAQNLAGTVDASLGRSRGAGTPPASIVSSHFYGGPHPPLSQSHNIGGIGMSDQELFSQGGAGLIQHRYVPEIVSQAMSCKWAKGTSGPAGDEHHNLIATSTNSHKQGVRRLTPLECERLQGFPDHYTAIIHRGKSAADGPRYKALGNSMAVPVMRWIGEMIAAVEYKWTLH